MFRYFLEVYNYKKKNFKRLKKLLDIREHKNENYYDYG